MHPLARANPLLPSDPDGVETSCCQLVKWNNTRYIYIYIFRNARASLVGEELFFSFRYCENIFKIIDDNFYVSLHILFLDIFLLLLRIRMLRGMMLLKFRSTKFRSFRCFIFLILNRF